MSSWILDVFRDVMWVPEPASTFATEIDLLHLFVISVTMLGVFSLVVVSIVYVIRYGGRGPGLTERRVTPLRVEFLIAGGLLALFLLWWVIGFRSYVRMRQPPQTGLPPVYVVAKQWMWKFVYPDGRVTVNELVVPRGEPVRLAMISRDVIHSFFVPAFRIKQDVVPGRFETTWFEPTRAGDFRLYCTEFCGTSHSQMLGVVRVLEPSAYAAWVDEGDRALDQGEIEQLAVRGRRVAAERACLGCHRVGDRDPDRAWEGPPWVGLYGSLRPLQDGSVVVADDAYLTRSMMRPGQELVAGFDDVMPTYQGQLTATETAALVEYIRSLREVP